MISPTVLSSFFFFNDTATTEIYTLSLHDALPISAPVAVTPQVWKALALTATKRTPPATVLQEKRSQTSCPGTADRKSTRLNSSHGYISYAVFCLKKKKKE